MAALRQNPTLRKQIWAEKLAQMLLASLRERYGADAVLECDSATDGAGWFVAGEPLDSSIARATLGESFGRHVLDLFDAQHRVGIRNAASWDLRDDHLSVPLRDLWVYTDLRTGEELRARRTSTGETIAQIDEDDGSVREVVLLADGTSRALDPQQDVPNVESPSPKPSVGIGVRRESKEGYHLGRGFGGRWELTGDVNRDRDAVVQVLERLALQVKRGDLDRILDREARHEGPYEVSGRA